jgi:hypothetical protein
VKDGTQSSVRLISEPQDGALAEVASTEVGWVGWAVYTMGYYSVTKRNEGDKKE